MPYNPARCSGRQFLSCSHEHRHAFHHSDTQRFEYVERDCVRHGQCNFDGYRKQQHHRNGVGDEHLKHQRVRVRHLDAQSHRDGDRDADAHRFRERQRHSEPEQLEHGVGVTLQLPHSLLHAVCVEFRLRNRHSQRKL